MQSTKIRIFTLCSRVPLPPPMGAPREYHPARPQENSPTPAPIQVLEVRHLLEGDELIRVGQVRTHALEGHAQPCMNTDEHTHLRATRQLWLLAYAHTHLRVTPSPACTHMHTRAMREPARNHQTIRRQKNKQLLWNDANTEFSQILAVMKYRWGVLWNARTAKRVGMKYGPWGCSQHGRSTHKATGTNMTEAPCPLCCHPDGGTHILAGCQHPRTKAQYIET